MAETAEKAVQVICRYCDRHVSGVVAGNYVRWTECLGCAIDPTHDLPWWRWLRQQWAKRQKAKRHAGRPKIDPAATGTDRTERAASEDRGERA